MCGGFSFWKSCGAGSRCGIKKLMLTSVDFFYVSLGLGVVILTGCAVAITVQIYRILHDVQSVTEDAAETAADISAIRSGVKVGVITLVQNLLEKAKGKGRRKD